MIRPRVVYLNEEAVALRDFLRSRGEREASTHLARALRHTLDALSHELARAGHPVPHEPGRRRGEPCRRCKGTGAIMVRGMARPTPCPACA